MFRKTLVAAAVAVAVGGATPATVAGASTQPSFHWSQSRVTAAQLGGSWHSGCPVGPSELRTVHLTFWGFDHQAHTGALVVRTTSVQAVVSVFRSIYRGRFPIRHMWPIAKFDGNDYRSMRNDNTSGFNCRYAKANGAKHWSMHAYGEAVDIDPVENPYEFDGNTIPRKGASYTNRSNVRPGMVVPGSRPVRAFSAVGWGWGGNWSSSPDYQHFSTNGS